MRRLIVHGPCLSHFPNAFHELWMAAAKARQGSAIEHIEAAARIGDHVMLVTPMLEQRHLAEEVALFQNYLAGRADLDDRLAARDDKHRIHRGREPLARRA